MTSQADHPPRSAVAGAGIGGGGGTGIGGNQTSQLLPRRGGDGATVVLAGGTLEAPTGGAANSTGEAGAPFGPGGDGISDILQAPADSPALGSVTATEGTTTIWGEIASPFTVNEGATVAVPSGRVLTLANESAGNLQNNGTIKLAGALAGAGILQNSGAITLDGSAWSVDGKGPGPQPAQSLTVAGNRYRLNFTVPSEFTAPASFLGVLSDDGSLRTDAAHASESRRLRECMDGWRNDRRCWHCARSARTVRRDWPERRL